MLEFFACDEIAHGLKALCKALSFNKDATLILVANSKNEDIAFTDGKKVTVNILNSLTLKAKDLMEAYYITIGLIGHECGHINFNDFEYDDKRRKTLENKKWFPRKPQNNKLPNFEKELKAFEEFLNSNPCAWKAIANISHQLQNVVDDEYIEHRQCQAYPGSIKTGIRIVKSSLINELGDAKNNKEQAEKTACDEIFGGLLEKVRIGELINNPSIPEAKKYLDEIDYLVKKIRYNNNWDIRYNIIDTLLVHSFPLWEEEAKAAAKNQQALEDFLNDLLEAMKEAIANIGGNSQREPQGSGQGEALGKMPDADGNITPDENDEGEGLDLNNTSFNKVIEIINLGREEKEKENNRQKDMDQMVKVISGNGGAHDGIISKYTIMGPTDNSFPEEIRIAQIAAQKIKNILEKKKKNEGAMCYNGGRFCPRAIIRRDYKCFQRDIEVPKHNMAVALYVDESGSMGGPRIETARKTAIILTEMCRELNIPTYVLGHSTNGVEVELFEYTDFSSKNKRRDISKMANMKARNSNRDGYGLIQVVNHIKTRKEKNKLIFVISDGQPAHVKYGGIAAKEDIQRTIKKARSYRIPVIATAIGNDKEQIKAIYGDGYLDVSNLNELPMLLVNIVKKNLI